MKKFILGVILFSQISFSQKVSNTNLNVEYDEYRIFTQGFINLDLGTLFVSDKISYYNSIVQKKITADLIPNERAIMFTKGTGNKEILPEIIIDREKNL